jgi:hypothetical protein
MRLPWTLALVSLLAALQGCREPERPPWGFDRSAAQRFVLETEELTEIAGARVDVARRAEISLEAKDTEAGGTDIALRVERYELRIEGAPDGTSEMALSPEGLVSRSAAQGETRLGPEEVVPGGRSVAALLRQPIGGFVVSGDGGLLGEPWHSREPILADLPLVEWVLLALPALARERSAPLAEGRPLPPLGQYRLGIPMSIRFERETADRIRGVGLLQRPSIELAPGYRGRLEVQGTAETALSISGEIEESKVELRTAFEGSEGDRVYAHYRARLRPDPQPRTVNPSPQGSDTPEG